MAKNDVNKIHRRSKSAYEHYHSGKTLEQVHLERAPSVKYNKYQKFGIYTNAQFLFQKPDIWAITIQKGRYFFTTKSLFALIDKIEWELYGLPDQRVASLICNCKLAKKYYTPASDIDARLIAKFPPNPLTYGNSSFSNINIEDFLLVDNEDQF